MCLLLDLKKNSACLFEDRYGQIVRELCEQGLLVPDDKVIRMTKKGLFLGDTVAERFILE